MNGQTLIIQYKNATSDFVRLDILMRCFIAIVVVKMLMIIKFMQLFFVSSH